MIGERFHFLHRFVIISGEQQFQYKYMTSFVVSRRNETFQVWNLHHNENNAHVPYCTANTAK